MADNIVIQSPAIAGIDMEKCYYNPGCGLSVYKPAAAEKLLEILQEYFGPVKPHNICCRKDPKLPQGSIIINVCGGCDKRFRTLYPGIETISIWEVLDSIENLPLPDYHGAEMSVQDPCPYRPKPQVHKAVRSLLSKMNIKVIDSPQSGQKSICCGDNFWPKLPIEKVVELQKKRGDQLPCQDVVVYCTACTQSMHTAGKTPRHMMDLLLEEETVPMDMPIDEYHCKVGEYMEKQ